MTQVQVGQPRLVLTVPALRRLGPAVRRVGEIALTAACGVAAALALGVPRSEAIVVLVVGLLGAWAAREHLLAAQQLSAGPILTSFLTALGVLMLVQLLFGVGHHEPVGSVAMMAATIGAAVPPVAWLLPRRRLSRVLVLAGSDGLDIARRMLAAQNTLRVVAVRQVGPWEGARSAYEPDWQVLPLARLDLVPDLVRAAQADTVLAVPGRDLDPMSLQRLGWALEDTSARLLLAGLPHGATTRRVSVTRLGGLAAVCLSRSRAPWAVQVAKCAIDRVGALLLLVVTLPVIAVCALLIRLETPGNPIFAQQRVGRDGAAFRLYKLRTMSVDAEARKATLAQDDEGNGLLFKIKGEDPRITRVGRVLRRLSLDELPQLVNVVRGEMSLIGPRPALPDEVARYDEFHRRRLCVRPGMTGLWQVSGRSDLSLEESLRLDLEYADSWSLGADLEIGLRTVRAVLSAKGAY